jgi:choline dehydrogenase-like flavoprotein
MTGAETYDVVIVGAGVNGSLIAKHLTRARLRVLVLEAGPATARTFDGYTQHLDHFYAAASKGPESPWPPSANAPQPDTADVKSGHGYFVQNGPNPYASSYSRLQGGSTLHWLGVSLRMLPEDFQLRSRYGVGRDWPLGYADLEPYYRSAEWEIGVAADVADQAHLGIEFPDGYDYPMRRVPPSYSDQVLAAAVDGMEVTVGGRKAALKIRSYPAARNSIPRGDYVPAGAVDERPGGPGPAGYLGQRCAGNTACTPICPVQAKYNAGKTLAQADRRYLRVIAQAVASKIHVDPVSGVVQGIEYQRYEDPGSPRHTVHVARARAYVLAAHAVENAKLMLASGLGGTNGIGKGLMDHPALYAWGSRRSPSAPTAARCPQPASRTCGAGRSGPGTPRSGSTSATTAGGRPPARRTLPSRTRSPGRACSERGCAAIWSRRCRATSGSPWRSSSSGRMPTASPSIRAMSMRWAIRAR